MRMTAGLFETEQAGVVMQAEHQGVDFEGEQIRIDIGAQVAHFHRQANRARHFAAPARLLLLDARAQRAVVAPVVFGHRADQHAAALVDARPLEPALDQGAHTLQSARLLDRRGHHEIEETFAGGVQQRQLQVFAGTEMGEYAAFGHAHPERQGADGQPFKAVLAGQFVGVFEDQLAGGGAFAGGGSCVHDGKIARPFVLFL